MKNSKFQTPDSNDISITKPANEANISLHCGGKRSATLLSRAGKLTRYGGFRKPRNAGRIALLIAFSVLHSSFCLQALGQSYSIDWFKISGGGGASTNGQYSVSGAIGQQDSGGPMTGGSYSLVGGFWALISAVQTPGLPSLIITRAGDSVIVSWPATGNYTLQQKGALAAPTGWVDSGYAITTANGTNSITITPPTANLFFRLKQ